MTHQVEVSRKIWQAAEKASRLNGRTAEEQVLLWIRVGKTSLDNPDLPASFIEASLLGLEEDHSELEAFTPRGD